MPTTAPYLAVSSLPRPLQPKIAFTPRIFRCSSRPDFLQVKGVCFRPPGTEVNLLDHVTFGLPEKSLGLIYGRSGSGKTTLLQVLAGLASPSEGYVIIDRQVENEGSSHGKPGIVFQFPERYRRLLEKNTGFMYVWTVVENVHTASGKYFLADTVFEELTFGLSSRSQNAFMAHQLHLQLHHVAFAVGLNGIPWDANPRSLSDGYKRRLALAVQLVRKPRLLLLDEPLAGLDWKARADVAKILASLKQEITLIVVSHDLKELTPVVDKAWRMDPGGRLTEATVPL